MLFPKDPNFTPTDMPACPLALNLSATAISNHIGMTEWSPDFYVDAITGANFTDGSWLVPGVVHTRGGVTANYSSLIAISPFLQACGNPPLMFTQQLFQASNIVLLSRGFCGSTCALFADTLHDLHGVKVIYDDFYCFC